MKSVAYKIFVVLTFLMIVVGMALYMQNFPILQVESLDELNVPYVNQNFFSPEHGRFLATFFCHFVFEDLPIFLNKHPLDLLISLVYPIHIVTISIFTIFLTFSFFIFSKYSIFKNNFKLSFMHSFVYLIISYYAFYSCIVISPESFFEYMASLLVYIPFMSILFYFLVTNNIPSKKLTILTSVLAALTALTVEFINIPLLLFLSILLICSIVNHLKTNNNIEKYKNKFFYYVYGSYLLFCTIYLCMPIDHLRKFELPDNFATIFANKIVIYFQTCMECHSTLLIIFGCLCIANLFFKTKNDFKISIYSALCIMSFYIFYVVGGATINTIYFGMHDFQFLISKQLVLFSLILLFHTLILADYILARIKEKYKINPELLKCCIIIAVLGYSIYFISSVKGNINFLTNEMENRYEIEKIWRKEFYQIDKTILKQVNNSTIYLPKWDDTELKKSLFDFYNVHIYRLYFTYFQKVYNPQDFDKKKFVITDKIKLEKLKDEETEKLEFSNLLKKPITKNEIIHPYDLNIISMND
jgi:hypothetical protein